MYYTGVGSRYTPDHIQNIMTVKLESEGYILRSGNAKGSDQAWELARKYNIPCFNLYLEENLIRIKNYTK